MSKVKLINNVNRIKEFNPEHAKNILAMENGGNWKVYVEPKKEDGNSGNKGINQGAPKE